MERYFGEKTPKLGFGLMRLPKLADGKIDIEQTSKMVDLFLEAGQTYFDTAYVYDAGESEKAAKAALVSRHPRESFTLATKLNVHANDCKNVEDAKRQLEISLERTGAGYFDYYLLHALNDQNTKTYDEYGIWDFVKEAKKKGLVKHWGFSYHGTPAFLDKLLTLHPDAEFVQLQINYADWENPNVASRENYETARRHGKSIVVMEPVKGGTLANPPQRVASILKEAAPELSLPSWAIRYVASMDGIITVLSGMSNLEQMEDNLSYMGTFRPLDEGEKKTIAKAQEALASVKSIPCTACHYCTEGCPEQIPIPDIFSARNKELIWNQAAAAKADYERVTAAEGAGKASDCIQCGQCEAACPQHIDIIDQLAECAKAYEN